MEVINFRDQSSKRRLRVHYTLGRRQELEPTRFSVRRIQERATNKLINTWTVQMKRISLTKKSSFVAPIN